MKSHIRLFWLALPLVLAGCDGPPDPPPEPTPRLDKVTVTCTPTTLEAGQSAQCTASATDQDGQPFSAPTLTWTSGDSTLAKVDGAGKVTTAVAYSGSVAIRVTARADDVTAQAESSLAITPKAPIVHDRDLHKSETWSANSPHLVTDYITVLDSAALTLEPGVVVRFAPRSGLVTGNGTLQAVGTAEAPILLEGQDRVTPASWMGIAFLGQQTRARLEFVTVRNAGGEGNEGGAISVLFQSAPVLRDVTVQNSGTVGVFVADDGSAFGADSTRLTITGSKGTALVIAANHADSLPAPISLSANASNVVELRGQVSRTQTWPNPGPGVPFTVPMPLVVANDKAPVALTISAGSVFRFGAESYLLVDYGDQNSLRVAGTPEAPVLFTADANPAKPGHWWGLNVVNSSKSPSSISHAIIEYAGSARDTLRPDYVGEGNLNIYRTLEAESAMTVKDVTVRKSSHIGITLDSVDFSVDSTRLTARDNGTYPISLFAQGWASLPKDSTLTGNARDLIEISFAQVFRKETWPRQSIPYFFNYSRLFVGSVDTSIPAELSIEAGTTVLFAPGATVWVGLPQYPGRLVASGTSAAPIRFLADDTSGSRGYWRGFHFWDAQGSKLEHVTIAQGGSAGGDSTRGDVGQGAVNVYQEIGAFVTNSTFTKAQGAAVTVSDGSRQGTTKVTTQFLPGLGNSASDCGSNTQGPN